MPGPMHKRSWRRRPHRTRPRRYAVRPCGILCACAALLVGFAEPVAAQQRAFEVGLANVLGSALVGGIGRALSGGSFVEGLRRGAESGAVVFAGKWVASRTATPLDQAAGRLVGQAGASMLRNAVQGEERFGRLTFVAGPVVVDVGGGVRARPDVGTLARAAALAADGEHRFEPSLSLRLLALTFTREPDIDWPYEGVTKEGNILFDGRVREEGEAERYWREIVAHEAVHLVQQDVNSIVFVQPLLDRVLDDPPFTLNLGNRPLRPLEYVTCGTRCLTETEAFALAQDEAWQAELYRSRSLWRPGK